MAVLENYEAITEDDSMFLLLRSKCCYIDMCSNCCSFLPSKNLVN